ncbi:DUF4349 domain-containing protein [Flavobacterium aquidurense]|jgi:hypothetical protein|uniref:DUF4349 domain-containing protein n=1 Tax=Flavobacterium aquidurense TaxID=362413 RepID=UPI000921BAB6|nr:DUF4349 domain-containing protein [Flavobacterium aquidurense]OXA72367.1 hypothetical protein B0A67_07440 [Flavobacterium aquidurense]SHG43085.1 protein of unknown function [Flavobacterium frigidimaris]
MAKNFRSRFLKLSKWSVGLFILLFAFRLLYGYVAADSTSRNDYSDNFFGSIDNLRKNYASEKIAMKGDNIQAASNMASSQKFEKTASIKAKTSEFDKDENLIKAKTKSYNAIIQYEQNLGQKGNRQIHLLIGINPAKFDNFYLELQKIGVLKDTEITKVDKTNEYRQLNAKKISIEKMLQSLTELKSKGGQIADFISLNDKILEVEEQLQGLGVELGNFNTENEFCTVRFSMYEGATEKSISFMHRTKVALEWTIKYFAIIAITSLFILIAIFVLLSIIDKLKIITTVNNKLNE